MYKEQSAAIKFNYPIIFRISGLTGLLLTIFSFLLCPRFTNEMVLDEEVQIVIEQIDIPQTEQFDRPPPPARPSVPVESESEDVADDVTLDEFNLDDFDAFLESLGGDDVSSKEKTLVAASSDVVNGNSTINDTSKIAAHNDDAFLDWLGDSDEDDDNGDEGEDEAFSLDIQLGAGKPKKGESARMKAKRKSFKARHRRNIAKGRMSAAYWADKVKW